MSWTEAIVDELGRLRGPVVSVHPSIHPSIHVFISRKCQHNENNNARKMTMLTSVKTSVLHNTVAQAVCLLIERL